MVIIAVAGAAIGYTAHILMPPIEHTSKQYASSVPEEQSSSSSTQVQQPQESSSQPLNYANDHNRYAKYQECHTRAVQLMATPQDPQRVVSQLIAEGFDPQTVQIAMDHIKAGN